MTKQEVIEAFKKGAKVRLTSGIWNYPQRDGKIAKSIEEIEIIDVTDIDELLKEYEE